MNTTPVQESGASIAPTSGSKIVLLLRSTEPNFIRNRINLALEAGFDWLRGFVIMGLVDPDTGGEIARHTVHGGKEAMGELTEIQVHLDPTSCAIWPRAGTTLMERLERYAGLIDGTICDATGAPMTKEDRMRVAAHIDDVLWARHSAKQKSMTVKAKNGEIRRLSEISFHHVVTKEADSKAETYRPVYLDVQPMSYYAGWAQGARMVKELIEHRKRHHIQKPPVVEMIREAVLKSAGKPIGDSRNDCEANVAAGFLDVLGVVIQHGLREAGTGWIDTLVAGIAEKQALSDKLREEQRAELVERLRKGREAAAMRRVQEGC